MPNDSKYAKKRLWKLMNGGKSYDDKMKELMKKRYGLSLKLMINQKRKP